MTTDLLERGVDKRERVWRNCSGLCVMCGTEMERSGEASDARRFTLEHLHPRSLGGSNGEENLSGSHSFCNQVRGTLSLDVFPDSWRSVLRELMDVPQLRSMNDFYVGFGSLRRDRGCVRF